MRALPLLQVEVSHLYERESLFEKDALGVSVLKKGYEHVKRKSSSYIKKNVLSKNASPLGRGDQTTSWVMDPNRFEFKSLVMACQQVWWKLCFIFSDRHFHQSAAKDNNSLHLIEMFTFSGLATEADSLGYLFWTVFLFITDWELF